MTVMVPHKARLRFNINRIHWTHRLLAEGKLYRVLEFHERANCPGFCEDSPLYIKYFILKIFFSFYLFFTHSYYTSYPNGFRMPYKAHLKQDWKNVYQWKLACAANLSLQEVNAKTNAYNIKNRAVVSDRASCLFQTMIHKKCEYLYVRHTKACKWGCW